MNRDFNPRTPFLTRWQVWGFVYVKSRRELLRANFLQFRGMRRASSQVGHSGIEVIIKHIQLAPSLSLLLVASTAWLFELSGACGLGRSADFFQLVRGKPPNEHLFFNDLQINLFSLRERTENSAT